MQPEVVHGVHDFSARYSYQPCTTLVVLM